MMVNGSTGVGGYTRQESVQSQDSFTVLSSILQEDFRGVSPSPPPSPLNNVPGGGDGVRNVSGSPELFLEGHNPYHEGKELFFPAEDIDVESFLAQRLQSPSALHTTKVLNGKKVTVNGKNIALFFYKGRFYAIDERCPHLGGPLHLGDIEDMGELQSPRVVCPWHKWCFELATGKQIRPPSRHCDIQSYPVQTDELGRVFIGFRSIDPACFTSGEEF